MSENSSLKNKNRDLSEGKSTKNLIEVIKLAISKVPSVKYALALSGFSAAGALIGSFFVFNWMIAGAVTIFTIIFSVVVIVFSKIPSSRGVVSKNQMKLLVWLSLFVITVTVFLILSSVFFGFPLNLMPDKVVDLAPTNKKNYNKESKPTLGSKADLSLEVRVEPHYSIPYGKSYFKDESGKLVSLRSFPRYFYQVHFVMGSNRSDFDEVSSSSIREAFRITLINQTENTWYLMKAWISQAEYNKLPDRYITNWLPKGLEKSPIKNINLSKNGKNYPILDPNEYVSIDQKSSQIILANISDAEPGIYNFNFKFKIQDYLGNTKILNSKTFYLTVPAQRSYEKESHGISYTGEIPNKLILKFLDLEDDSYQKAIFLSEKQKISLSKLDEGNLMVLSGSKLIENLKESNEKKKTTHLY